MAVSFTNISSLEQGNGQSISLSFTPGADVNLVIAALTIQSTGTPSTAITSFTYGALGMTFLGYVIFGGNEIWLYYLTTPPAGASTVTATWTSSTITNRSLAVSGYSGVSIVSPFGSVASNGGTSTAPGVNVTSNPQELVIDVVSATGANLSVGSGQTQRFNHVNNLNAAGSDEPGAATVNMSWSLTGSVNWAIIAVPLRPQTSFFLMYP